MEPEELLDFLSSRASVTRYTDEDLDREQIGTILEAGRWAPSAGNMQCWEFIVVEDKKIKEKLSMYSYNQSHIRKAPICIVVLGDEEKATRRFKERGKNLYMIQETAAAMQNMLLMAQSLDLGAAWVGAFKEEDVKDLLEIPENLRPLSMITVGYPRERPHASEKKRMVESTFVDTYGQRLHRLMEKREWKGLKTYFERFKEKIKREVGSD